MAFQDAILNPAQATPCSIMASRQQTAAERFEIYQDAYRLRLTEFLSNDFPVLRIVLGDDDFALLAQAYIEATPSPYRNARWYGRGLPDFMQATAPWQLTRALGDLASFERALDDAFDAANSPAINATALAEFAAEDQPRLRFTFQAGLTLLTLAKGVVAAHQAVMADLDVEPPSSTEEETIVIWRDRAEQAFYRVLEEDEALALDCASMGGTFAEICGLLSLRMDEEAAANHAAVFLIQWFTDGLIANLACE
jgi:hypothetical protein